MSHVEIKEVVYLNGHRVKVGGLFYRMERACRNVSTVRGKFTCSECRQSWRLNPGVNGEIGYCPSCGARLVE